MDAHATDALRFGIVAEIHRAPAGTPRVSWHNEMLLDRSDELLALALDQLASQDVGSVVLLGDLTSSADDESFTTVIAATARIGRPILAVPGNHDAHDEHALARFANHLRGPDVTAAPGRIRLNDHTTIVLTNVEFEPATGAFHSSGFPDLTSLQEQTIIVFSHYPLLPMETRLRDAGLKHSGDLTDRPSIADRLLAHHGPVIVIHGHLHVRAASADRNVLHLSCAALVEPPHEVSLVSVEGHQGQPVIHFSAKSVMTSNAKQIPVLDLADHVWQFANGAWSKRS